MAKFSMKKDMKENCYIQSLKLGFENTDGISMHEIIKQLDIDLDKDIAFKLTYSKWFFENFQTESSSNFPTYNFKKGEIDNKLEIIANQKAFLKGDALNKYIDYLELERTRESSLSAQNTAEKANNVSKISIALAIVAILIQIIASFVNDRTPQPPFDVKVINTADFTDTIIINKVQDRTTTPKSK